MPLHSSASTTIMTQPQQEKLNRQDWKTCNCMKLDHFNPQSTASTQRSPSTEALPLWINFFDGLYDYVDYTPDFTSWYYSWHDEYDNNNNDNNNNNNNNNVYGLLQDDAPGLPVYADYIVGDASQQEANVPKTYKTPRLPTQHKIDEHNLTHLPYGDWCKHCVQGKSKSQHHQCGGLTKQSITRIDYAFLKNDNAKHNATVLTICGSITGLGYATSMLNHSKPSHDSSLRTDYRALSYN
eukprot:4581956-Amphidinium_carterae.3